LPFSRDKFGILIDGGSILMSGHPSLVDELVAMSSCTTTRNNIEMPNQTFSKEDKCFGPCPQVPCPFVLSSIINWCIIFFL